MKKTLSEQRDADLISAARRVLAAARLRGEHLTKRELIERTLTERPRSYYLTYDTASRRLHDIERRGLEAVVRSEVSRRQWVELRQQIDEAMNMRRQLKFCQALTFVLHFRRPSQFYIGYTAAFKILQNHFRPTLIDKFKPINYTSI